MKNIFSTKNLKAILLVFLFGSFTNTSIAEEYRYYLAQWNGQVSTIYQVNIAGSDADLVALTEVPYGCHIAFNESTKEIVIINSTTADFQTYNVETDVLGVVYDIDASNGQYVATGFNGEGSILIGNASNGKVYSNPADFLTNTLTEIGNGPVSGGDLLYNNGDLYLATRSGNRLMKFNGATFDSFGNIASNVTGAAAFEGGKFILSFFGSTTLKIYNADGSFDTEVTTRIGDNVYTQLNGDMTSGTFSTACLPMSVYAYEPGPQADGISPVSAARQFSERALVPEKSDATVSESDVNFASLGFGGYITLEFETGIANGPGDDVMVYETTYSPSTENCNRYPEKIRAYASQDGCNFWYIGEGCQNTSFDLGYGGAPFTWAKFIKLVDISDASAGVFPTQGGDGYDVDGIECLNGSSENTELEGTFGSATEAWLEQGNRRNGTPVAASRSVKENALGLPQNTDVVNFVSLGFGGKLILKLDFVVFDQAGNDIQIVETSFGNPSCNSYPEKVMVRGSLNGVDYFDIASEDICLDGEIDIAAYGPIQYLELMDRSALSDFSGSADGYDVDGVVVLTSCDGEGIDQARISDDVTTPDELISLSAYPNPFSNVVTVEISTGANDNTALVEVSNYLGQQVSSERINVASASQTLHNVNARDLQKGVYFITVTTDSSKETLKVIKN